MNIILLAILIICVITDLKSRKIYNKVVFPGLLVAFVFRLVTGGWGELTDSLSGFLIGLGILMIPYLLGGMGAGDVKLLALVGAFKGTAFVLYTSLYMALLGGLMAILLLLSRQEIRKRLKFLFYYLYGLRYGLKIPFTFQKGTLSGTYPYGVAIAGGALLSFVWEGWLSL